MKIAVISDIHSNKPALDAVILDIKKNNCTHIFVLGDLIGYYHWPKAVVEELMTLDNCTVIRGNHEDLLIKARTSKEFNTELYKKYGSGLNVCIESLSFEQMTWLDSLPISVELCIDNLKIGLFHGSERETDEYIYPDAPNSRIKEIPDNRFDFIFLVIHIIRLFLIKDVP
ncbi:metallophosphoesterase family protein [Photobacterium leiognathi]|uniref:metallophosphoesterase family protein n=1 Tax=Photobacterium leiognathi TaxID=553611 RepID=UPI002735D680|nr:metallophosphoesterase [Photobacterium leiognathi]